MKIGIYDMYLDALGGGEKYMLSIASFLAKNHSVSIFWSNKEILERAKKRFNLPLSEVTIDKNIFSLPISFYKKKKTMESYDMLIYLSDGSIPFLFGKKNIIHFQFPTPWVNGNSIVTKIKMSRIKTIVCNSSFTKKYIDAIFNVNSKVLYPPCSLITSNEKKENMILTVGRYNKIGEHNDFKKLEQMISFFKEHIYPKHKDWKLTLVVTYFDQDKEVIDRWEEELRTYPITIVRNADHTTLATLYGKAMIYWHAAGFGENLEDHPERAEHFGIAPVEAMSAGAVPILINAGGLAEIVEHGVNGYIWNSKEQLVSYTEDVIKDKKLREELSQEARKRAKHFSEEAFEKHLREILL